MPLSSDEGFADAGHAFPCAVTLARDGTRAYVVNTVAGSVTTIDTKTRTVLGVSPRVGFSPSDAAVAGGRVLVTNEGLMRYAKLAAPQLVPSFNGGATDIEHASSLSFLPLATDGSFAGSEIRRPSSYRRTACTLTSR
jgi:YVTN family beta-propeller protein